MRREDNRWRFLGEAYFGKLPHGHWLMMPMDEPNAPSQVCSRTAQAALWRRSDQSPLTPSDQEGDPARTAPHPPAGKPISRRSPPAAYSFTAPIRSASADTEGIVADRCALSSSIVGPGM